MRNQRGFSLIEVVAVLGLVGILGVVVMNITGEAFKSQKKVSAKMDIHSDLVILENVLSNMINTLDMRMTFTGPGLQSTSSTMESRFLIPLKGQCRDLSTTNCNLDTSLMFVNHKTKNNPAVDAVCNFNAPHAKFPNPPSFPSPNNYKIFVFNGLRTTYGTNTISTSPSQIVTTGADLSKAGTIKLAENDIFSIFDGTSSSLWRVTKELQHFNAPSSPMALMMLSITLPNCYSRLHLPNPNVYYLYAAPLKPNHVTTNFFTDLRTDIMKLNNVAVMSIGRKEADKTFGVNKCVWDGSGNKISCSEDSQFPKLSKIDLSRMDEEFKLPINPQTQLQWYEMGNPCTNPAICTIGNETNMPVASTPPGLAREMSPSNWEIKDVPFLLGPSFSFYKQEFLHRIRFRLKQENKRRDVYIRFF